MSVESRSALSALPPPSSAIVSELTSSSDTFLVNCGSILRRLACFEVVLPSRDPFNISLPYKDIGLGFPFLAPGSLLACEVDIELQLRTVNHQSECSS